MILFPILLPALAMAPTDERPAYAGPTAVESSPDARVEVAHSSVESAAAPSDSPTAAPAPAVAPAVAQDVPDAQDESQPWTVGGFVDVSYAFSSNTPQNHIYRGTNTTPRTNEFTIPAAGAYLLREPDKVPIRFALGVHAGAAVDTLYAPEPVPGGDAGRAAGAEVWKHLALANVGVKIDKSGTEIGAGLFGGPMGIGGFWSKDNWNYTPSWESNAAPFYVAGARVAQDVNVGTVEAWIVNGWQMLADNNSRPSYIVGTNLGKNAFSFGQWVYFGPEQADVRAKAWRVHTDTLFGYNKERWGIAGVWDFGTEERGDLVGTPRYLWTGGALFVRAQVFDLGKADLEVAVRPEAWWDRDGVMFGANQWLLSTTGTVTLDLYDHLQIRAEYRYDGSTADPGYFYSGDAITDDDPNLARQQHTMFLAMVGYFDHVFAFARRK